MRVTYRIRRGDDAGGPVDPDSVPYAEVDDAAELTLPAPAAGEIRRYRVNAYDEDTGLEERSAHEATVLGSDAGGASAQDRPRSPGHVTALAGSASGSVAVRWTYLHPRDNRQPTGFRVYVTAGSSVDYGDPPAATVAHVKGRPAYGVEVAGLTPGADYAVAVRASNADGEDLADAPALITLPDASGSAPAAAAGSATWAG